MVFKDTGRYERRSHHQKGHQTSSLWSDTSWATYKRNLIPATRLVEWALHQEQLVDDLYNKTMSSVEELVLPSKEMYKSYTPEILESLLEKIDQRQSELFDYHASIESDDWPIMIEAMIKTKSDILDVLARKQWPYFGALDKVA